MSQSCRKLKFKLEHDRTATPVSSGRGRNGPARTYCASARRLRKHLLDVLPVHEVFDERLEVVGPAVAVVDVVGVLPDIDAEDRLGAVDERVLAVRRLHDREPAILDGKPGPARAELRDARLNKVLLELLDAAEFVVDAPLQAARNRAAAVR